MLELTAVFESWLIGDGDYPPFTKGMVVNLSFMVEPASISHARSTETSAFHHRGMAEYDFCGDILQLYSTATSQISVCGIKLPWRNKLHTAPPLGIIDTGEFRFYIESKLLNKFKQGMQIKGSGTLQLDWFTWTEFLNKRTDPPDIFYVLEVTRIRKIQIPERFIYRHDGGKALPTRVPPDAVEDIDELETMEGQKFDEEFYLVDFKGSHQEGVPKTFIYI